MIVLVELPDVVAQGRFTVWDIPAGTVEWPPEDLNPLESSNDLGYLEEKYSIKLCEWVW
jgi:hypothetical protein